MDLLNNIKKSLRIFNTDFDDEINHLIEEAKEYIATVASFDEENKIMQSTIRIYVKANFGNNEKRNEFMASFYSMLAELSLKYPNAN